MSIEFQNIFLLFSKLLNNKIYDGLVLLCPDCKEDDYFAKNKSCTKIESFDTIEELELFYKKYSLLK